MSRSFKHTPIGKTIIPKMKHYANKKVRQQKNKIPNRSFYKKIFQQYEICDQRDYCSFQTAYREWDISIVHWYQWYYRK